MSGLDSGRGAPGFKLFGTTIPVQVKQVEEETQVKEETSKMGDTVERRPEKIIPCPRCKSMETKFCYFNNYNVNQPRHFCKGCQRYWTAGGTLRNVPVGAGRRKNKPPCHGPIGFSDNCLFDSSGLSQFELEGVVEQWHMSTTRGSFQHVYPAKRRSNSSAGQIC